MPTTFSKTSTKTFKNTNYKYEKYKSSLYMKLQKGVVFIF